MAPFRVIVENMSETVFGFKGGCVVFEESGVFL